MPTASSNTVKENAQMKKFFIIGAVVVVATALVNVKKVEFTWVNPLLK
jgi:hypothetical protein